MKRVLSILLIVLLLVALPLTLAQEDVPSDEKEENKKPLIQGINEINQGVENDISIPAFLEYTARVVFKLDGQVYLSQFIILSCLFLLILLFLFNIIRISDFPGGKLTSFTVVLIITLIGSSSGGLRLVGDTYLFALYKIQLFNEYHFLGIALTIIIFLFLIYIIGILSRFTKEEAEYKKGYSKGLEINKAQTLMRKLAGIK